MTSRRPLFRFPWRSRRQIARDLDAELTFHVDMRIAELTAAGVDHAEARRRAVAEFGDFEQTRAYCRDLDADTERDVRISERLGEWQQDVRFAWRTIRRSPSFAIISVLTLVTAIGANTAIFSVTRAVLLAPLPYGSPGSIVAVYERPRGAAGRGNPLSVPDFVDYRAAQRSLSGMAAYSDRSVTWRPAVGDTAHQCDVRHGQHVRCARRPTSVRQRVRPERRPRRHAGDPVVRVLDNGVRRGLVRHRPPDHAQ